MFLDVKLDIKPLECHAVKKGFDPKSGLCLEPPGYKGRLVWLIFLNFLLKKPDYFINF